MTDAEGQALAWVGQRSQRVMTLTGVPFVVVGVLSMIPGYVLLREVSFWLVGVNIPAASAALACAPAAGIIGAGMVVSRTVMRWSRPALIREAAERFGVDETILKDVFS